MSNKKSVLITGASSGIGKACAIYLAEQGFKVYAGIRKETDREMLLKEDHGLLTPIILDVVKAETIIDAVNTISEDTEYSLWGLVNNAGIGISGVLEAIPAEELRRLLEVNVIGLHAVTRAFLPLLRKSHGRIVNIGSISSYIGSPGSSSYSASKFAVRGFTDALRLELQPFGMHVSLIAPGAIQSAIWEKSKAYKKKLRKNTSPEVLKTNHLFVQYSENIINQVKPIPALFVAKAVAHALTKPKPKYVYVIGKDAKLIMRMLKLPKRLFNWLILKHITLEAKRSHP
ncbi:SDR family oxidoreductase [Marinilabiliaceae bacterium JC017]|nr:SDR family oxidoreductase [Marinilabiliaceae bacterium JC017]